MYRSCIFCSAHPGRDEGEAAWPEAEGIAAIARVLPPDRLRPAP